MSARRVRQALKRWSGIAAVRACYVLDAIPCREQGRWYRHGGWGCRIGLGTYWGRTVADEGGQGKKGAR